MEDKERKRLILLRGQCKGTITRQEKFLMEHATIFTLEDLEIRKQVISDTWRKYEECQTQLSLLGDIATDDEIEERVLLLQVKITRLIKTFADNTRPNQPPEGYKAKLPALEIPVFDGKNIAEYKPFIEMFEAVVDRDHNVPNIQKLCFLKKYLRDEPLQLIDSLPILGDSNKSALKLLQRRYQNTALLANNHVSIILDLPNIHKGTALQLRDFVAKVRQHLTALINLELPVSSWDAILSTILLRKLDSLTARLYHSDRDTTSIPAVKDLLEFLDKRAAALEARPTANDRNKSNKSNISLLNSSSNAKPTAQCLLCSQPHKLHTCPKFIAMTAQDRLQYVNTNKLCKICLARHQKKCRYSFKCGECQANHNTLIHIGNSSNSKQENADTKPVSLHSVQPKHTDVLLPTAKVLVADGTGNKYIVRALLDSGSQTSFCTTELAQKLNLDTFSLNKNIITLGGNQGESSKGVNLTIYSRVKNYKLDITCSIINTITSKLPQRAINLNNFSIPKSIALADDEFNVPGDISLLLSADVFFRILQDGKVEGNPGDPVLINTRLGYIVSTCGYTSSNVSTTLAMHTVVSSESDLDVQVKQFWETEKVPEVYHEALPEHEYSLKVFQESVTLTKDHFEVKLPLKIPLQEVDPSNSYAISLQRLYNLLHIPL